MYSNRPGYKREKVALTMEKHYQDCSEISRFKCSIKASLCSSHFLSFSRQKDVAKEERAWGEQKNWGEVGRR